MGVLFGLASNLIEGFFFKRMLEEDCKEYGSSVFGLVISIVMWLVMSTSDIVTRHLGYADVFYSFGPLMLLSLVAVFTERYVRKHPSPVKDM